jgi:MFS family permease
MSELMQTPSPITPAAGAEKQPWPSSRQVWGGVSLFGGTVFVLFANNTIVGLLLQMIKKDFGLSDTGVSWIVGFAGVLFGAAAALPVARLIDRTNRKTIIGIGLVVVSLGTVLCGISRGFWGLLIGRLVGGVGGSGNGPAAYSILADYMPPPKLPRALAVMNIGFALSRPAAMIFGGALIALAVTTPQVTLPLIGTLHPWQVVFLYLAIPEITLAVLALSLLHEPRRRGLPTADVIPLRDVFRYLWDHRRAFAPMFGGLALNSLAFGTAIWEAAFFQRTYGWSPAQYGLIEGSVLFVLSPLGMLAGGFIAEWLGRKGYDDANLRVVFYGMLLHLPFAILYPLMPTPLWAIALSAINTSISGGLGAPQNAALQVLLPSRMRGIITALYLLVFTLVGFGLAPTVVALITDHVIGDESKIRYSLVLLQAVAGPLAAFIFYLGMKPYGKEFARVKSWYL